MATGSPAVGEILEIGGRRYEVTRLEKIDNQLKATLTLLPAAAPVKLVE